MLKSRFYQLKLAIKDLKINTPVEKKREFIINNVLIFKLLTFFAPVLLKDIASFIIIHFVLKVFFCIV